MRAWKIFTNQFLNLSKHFSKQTISEKFAIPSRRNIWKSKRLKQDISSSIWKKICEVANEAIKFSWQISIKMADLKKKYGYLTSSVDLNKKVSMEEEVFRIIIWKILVCVWVWIGRKEFWKLWWPNEKNFGAFAVWTSE